MVLRFYFDRFFLVMQIVCVSEILNNNSLMDKAKEEKMTFPKSLFTLYDSDGDNVSYANTLSDIH